MDRRNFLFGSSSLALSGGKMFPEVRFDLTNWSGVAEQGTWTGYKEDGTVIGSATGDVTSILQDTMDYAVVNGYSFRATGRTYQANGSVPFLCLYGTITIKPSICNVMLFDNCCILSRPVNRGPGLVFDSFEDLTFEYRGGQFVYEGDVAGVRFEPTNLVPADNAILCALAKVKFQAITIRPNSGIDAAAVEWNPGSHKIWAGQYNFGEVDGLGVVHETMRVMSPTNGGSFENNMVTASMVSNSTRATVQVGMGQGNQQKIRHNSWKFGSLQPGTASSDGFNTFGCYDRIEVGVIGNDNMAPNGLNRGIVLEPGSVGNRYSYNEIYGSNGGDVVNAGTDNVRY